jgi:hypothetical protein
LQPKFISPIPGTNVVIALSSGLRLARMNRDGDLTKDEARLIAANVAKLRESLKKP